MKNKIQITDDQGKRHQIEVGQVVGFKYDVEQYGEVIEIDTYESGDKPMKELEHDTDFQIGDGATICFWSDRHAVTVIKRTAKTVTVQRDRAIRTDKNGMSESQNYRYERDEEGMLYVFTLRNNGKWIRRGDSLSGARLIPGRHEYYDFSF